VDLLQAKFDVEVANFFFISVCSKFVVNGNLSSVLLFTEFYIHCVSNQSGDQYAEDGMLTLHAESNISNSRSSPICIDLFENAVAMEFLWSCIFDSYKQYIISRLRHTCLES